VAVVVVIVPLPETLRSVLGSVVFLALLARLVGSVAGAAHKSRLEPGRWLRIWWLPIAEASAVVIVLLLVVRLL
jgi:hypothetical protein